MQGLFLGGGHLEGEDLFEFFGEILAWKRLGFPPGKKLKF